MILKEKLSNANEENITKTLEVLYQTYLNRKPDISGFNFYKEKLLNASDQLGEVNQIIDAMLTSEERLNQLKTHNKVFEFSKDAVNFFDDKQIKSAQKFKNIALLGTCVSENLTQFGNTAGRNISHYLMGSLRFDVVPRIQKDHLDAAIVHLTLRHFLWDLLDGSVAGDVLHVREDYAFNENYDHYLEKFKNLLSNKVGQILDELSFDQPVFFLSFIEPPAKVQGDFLTNRSKSFYRLVRDVNDYFEELLSNQNNAYYLEMNDLVRFVGDAHVLDNKVTHLSHNGILISEHSDLLINGVFERLDSMMIRLNNLSTIKLIITDLDNTLWKGVAAEFETIIAHELTEGWPLGYIEALLEFKRRGGLLAISSKNNHEETVNRFDHIWEQKIKVQDFCSLKINWNPKSQNIAEILKETNLLPENVLFIDDNPREIEEVTSVFPTLNTLSGDQTLWKNKILYAPEMQVANITAESAKRTALIQAKIQRDDSEKTMNREEFLLSLELKAVFNIISDRNHSGFNRAFELINKTNQFNTTGKKWVESELISLLEQSKLKIYTAQIEDKFSNNGVVAIALVEEGVLSQFVMSCRVFGLGVETALLSYICRHENLKEALYRETGKNKASSFFYADHGFTQSGDVYKAASLKVDLPHWMNEVA